MIRRPVSARRPGGARRLLSALTLAAAAALVLSGCVKGLTVNDSTATGDLPPIGTVVADYDAMLAAMRDAVSAAAPGGTWTEVKAAQTLGGDEAAAGEDATVAVSPLWGYDAAFPTGSEREALIAELGRIGEQHGFTAIQVYVDRADEVQAVGGDGFGAEYQVGSKTRSTLSYTTGSHPAG